MPERVTVDDGVGLWTTSSGAGPPLLLCHGGPGAFDTLGPVAGMVDDLVRVHRWDQRGAGRSDPEGPFTIARFLADMEQLREHWGYRRWTVGGHSWGATLALLYAQEHPERVDAVLYLAGTGLEWWPVHRRRFEEERIRRLGPERARRLAELGGRDRTSQEEREHLHLQAVVQFADGARADALADRVVEDDLRHPWSPTVNEQLTTELKALSLAELEERCRRMPAPVLVVDCVGDARPAEATDSLVAALRHVQRVRIDAGHYPWLEAPEALRMALRSFLQVCGPRRRTIATVAEEIAGLVGDDVVRVAVDGVDGAGKSVFADELADDLERAGIRVLRASVDGFHNPPEVRHARGRTSPEGFFHDSYDYDALERLLLRPLEPGADRQVVRAVHDVDAERRVEPVVEDATDVKVLILDGIFLHRDRLRHWWHHSVFLDVDFEVATPRGAQRFDGDPDPAAASNRRYVEGQRLYLRECEPQRRASVVIDNNDLATARIVARR